MKRIFILAATVIGFAGCSTQTPTEANYGKAVREMISAQVADPATLTNPSTAPVTGADPDMVNAAVNTLRGEVSKPEDVKRDIVLKLGGK
jgi:type IV pilus biogenesis protein CpaD/CtpE